MHRKEVFNPGQDLALAVLSPPESFSHRKPYGGMSFVIHNTTMCSQLCSQAFKCFQVLGMLRSRCAQLRFDINTHIYIYLYININQNSRADYGLQLEH